MRVAIDLQGIQSEGSRSRGIGRYSLEIIKYMIKGFQDYHFILVANAALDDLNAEFENELSFPNVTYFKWYSPGPIDYISNEFYKTKVAINLRSYAFSCLNADIIFITSFLEGFADNCLVDLDKDFFNIPIVSIFYDLIPLINPNLYLNNNPQFSKYYKLKLEKMKDLDGLLAISDSSAKEAIQYLNYNPNNIFNVSSACNIDIFNTTRDIEFTLSDVLDKYTPFILYSGASDPRKNINRLLIAYSKLPLDLKHYKLILVGKLLVPELKLINQWIKDLNINVENVYITGYISDSDLVGLYRKCSLYVFPSLHEGFGLPILEAMSCGAAVIGSHSTSIPEVIGLKEAMFDPYNVHEITALISKSLRDIHFYSDLKTNANLQSKKFSWNKTAKLAIEAFQYFVKAKNKNNHNTYNSVHSLNKNNFDLLIKKIKSLRSKNLFNDDDFDCQVAASIDKINTQLNKLNREFFRNNENLIWKVEGPFDSSYSLAILNRYFVESLEGKVERVLIHVTEGFGDYIPNVEYLKQYPKTLSILEESKKNIKSHDVLSRNLYPPRVKDMKAKYNILHSYGWEESSFPFEWVQDFNTYLQGITVMSSQVKKILIDNGVALPIKVCGLGVDHFNNIKPDIKYNVIAKKYKFLHLSSCFPRKGIDILIKAFVSTFTNQDDVSLIIKTFDNKHNNVENLITKLRANNSEFPDIIVIYDELSLQQIKSLYLQANVLVAPSRGEGFGLPIAEAMMLDLPVITTDWGGQKDFCNSDNSWLIEYEFKQSMSHFGLHDSYWAEPSQKHLSHLLKEVYYSSKAETMKKTNLAKNLIKSFTWNQVAEQNINALNNKFVKSENRITKIGWVSTWSSKCGIASYSRRFINYMPDDIYVFSPLNELNESSHENLNLVNEDHIVPSWESSSITDQNLDNLFLQIKSRKISSLVIQFNFGFFDIKQLSLLVDRLCSSNINVLIVLHSTILPEAYDLNYLSSLKNLLKKCTRILVHTVNDLNRLKNINLVDNVTLLSHPILDYKNNDYGISNKFKFKTPNNEKLNIVSYGFCLPAKGFLELIQAINILRNSSISLRLDIYSSIYSEEYHFLFKELVELVNELDLANIVNLYSEYIPENQLIPTLSKYDLVVFPYQKTNESSSASVRDGLASMKPVIATPLSIFDDVQDLADFFQGTSPDHMANGIIEWQERLNTDPHKFMNTHLKRIGKINQRRYSLISKKLSMMINSLEINQ